MRTYVLVHGGNCTGAVWSRMTSVLRGQALTVDLPGRNDDARHAAASFEGWADAVVADMDRAGFARPIIIGHSMGGGTLAALARRHPGRVEGIIFFSAVVPPDGRPFREGLTDRQQEFMREQLKAGRATIPRRAVSEDEPGSPDRQFVRGAGSSEALAPFFEPVSLAGLAAARVGFVKLLRDQSLTPSHQEVFIARLRAIGPCEVRTLDGSHMAMVGRPAESAAVIDDLIDAWNH